MSEDLRMKLGLWLPVRDTLSSISIARPGMLLSAFQADIVRKLELTGKFDTLPDLDFRQATVHRGDVRLGNFSFRDLDVFFWFGELDRNLTGFHLCVLDALANHTRVFNGAAAQRLALDKYNTQLALERVGVSVPEFHLVTAANVEIMRDRFDQREYLLKPRLGSFGVGIVRVSTFEQLVDVIDYSPDTVHFVEEYVPCSPDTWIGVNVLGSQLAFGYTKDFAGGKWKHLDRCRQGGRMRLRRPSAAQETVAVRVGHALGLDFYGVDMLTHPDGRDLVIDVNTFPGLYPAMFDEAGVDGAQLVVDMIEQRLEPLARRRPVVARGAAEWSPIA